MAMIPGVKWIVVTSIQYPTEDVKVGLSLDDPKGFRAESMAHLLSNMIEYYQTYAKKDLKKKNKKQFYPRGLNLRY